MTPKRETRAAGHGDARDRNQAQSWSAAQPKHSTPGGSEQSWTGTEADLQRAARQLLTVALPRHEALFFHVPNGGYRALATAGRLKAEGVVPGVADFIVIWKGRALAIELKACKGRLSKAQQNWGDAFTLAGGCYAVCRSLGDVGAFLDAAGVPLRASVGEAP
jgi:hypothetical protein